MVKPALTRVLVTSTTRLGLLIETTIAVGIHEGDELATFIRKCSDRGIAVVREPNAGGVECWCNDLEVPGAASAPQRPAEDPSQRYNPKSAHRTWYGDPLLPKRNQTHDTPL